MATVRGVSVKLLRARPRVLGLSSDFRAPRPRCIRPVSTHPSSRPREPVTSCDPEPLRSLRFVLTPPGLEAPWAASPCLRHCCRKNREACTGRLGPADARGRGNARFTTRVFASANRCERTRCLLGIRRRHGSITPLTLRHPSRFSDSRFDASLRFFRLRPRPFPPPAP
jgi:hypothetical protein